MPDPTPLQYQSASHPAVWKDGSLLVVRRKTDLSDKCVCCGKPAGGPAVPVKLYSASARGTSNSGSGGGSTIFLVITLIVWICQLIVVLVDLIEASNRRIMVGLCEEHQSRRRTLIVWSRGCVAVAMIGFVSCFFVWSMKQTTALRTIASIAVIVVPVLLLVLAYYLSKRVPGLRLSRETGDLMWVRGAGTEFLAGLPVKKG